MKRCDKPAKSYSWFNGFRACDECIAAGEPHEFDTMIRTAEVQGPCDKPVETRDEFFARIADARGEQS